MPITTTITFADLIQYYEQEREETREAYDELLTYAREEYGDERAEWPDELTAVVYLVDESAKTVEKRIHALERFQDAYESQEFRLKMLSGQELVDIETDLRMTAQARDVEVDELQAEKKMAVIDAAVVDAPPETPTDDDGDPVPSEEPNPLATALYEQVQLLNQSGDTDFRPQGFGEQLLSAVDGRSANPSSAAPDADDLPPTDGDSPPPGNS